jgi:hypothetical protein
VRSDEAAVRGRGEKPRLTFATFWSGPLGYPQAALTALAALAVGVWFHLQVGYRVPVDAGIAWPMGLAFLLGTAAAGRVWRDRRTMRWISGVPFALCALAVVGLLSLVGAVVPSSTLEARFGVDSVFTSWPFRTSLALVLLNLIAVTARRCWPLNATNAWFTLCHLGLITAILGGWMGAATLDQATLTLYQGRPERVAERADGTPLRLPFDVMLRRFDLEQFPPVLGIGEIDPKAEGGIRFLPGDRLAAEGVRDKLVGIEVEVKRYLPRAALVGDTWHAATLDTCAPAALVVARDASGKQVAEGWVSCGSIDTPRLALTLTEKRAVMMAAPRPKEFRSSIVVDRGGRVERHEVRMNRTANIGTFRLYQTSYDEAMGPASKFSVLTVVEDRSIVVVYAGMFMVLASVLWMLWNGFRAPAVGAVVTEEAP